MLLHWLLPLPQLLLAKKLTSLPLSRILVASLSILQMAFAKSLNILSLTSLDEILSYIKKTNT
jgi:hypothetical protein